MCLVVKQRTAIDVPPGVVFLIDSNEASENHLAYDLAPSRVKKLQVSDYSISDASGQDLDGVIAVERKSLENLLSDTTGSNRERWERCLARLAQVRYRAVVIEADWGRLRGPFKHTAVNPTSVRGSLIAWQLRHGISFWMAGSRAEGEELTRRLLLRGLIEHQQAAAREVDGARRDQGGDASASRCRTGSAGSGSGGGAPGGGVALSALSPP